jgi:hypothetical protein
VTSFSIKQRKLARLKFPIKIKNVGLERRKPEESLGNKRYRFRLNGKLKMARNMMENMDVIRKITLAQFARGRYYNKHVSTRNK